MDNHPDTADTTTFNDKTDITEQLLHRYGKSSASQHRHLCASAAASRSIIVSESLPLTPLSYFAATISTLSENTLDADALSALSSFLAIVLPLVPEKAIAPDKAADGISVLLDVLERRQKVDDAAVLGTSSTRALVKCLGILLAFCDSDDWDSVKLGFQTILKYSIDKRPKVRKCAQDCLLAIFKSFGSNSVSKQASKSVYSLLKDHVVMTIKLNASKPSVGQKADILSKPEPEHQEVLHLLNLLKSVVPYLTAKICSKILSQLLKLASSRFSAMTRHIFDIIGVIFDALRAEQIVPVAENVIKFLISYISTEENNPIETRLFAATLVKSIIGKLCVSETSEWINHVPLVIGSVAGLLTFEACSALQASNVLKELITFHIHTKDIMRDRDEAGGDEPICNSEVILVKSTCSIFQNMLSTSAQAPNEHILEVLSVLFLQLGSLSDIYMKNIVLKLAGLMNTASDTASDTKHLQECIGSAIVAMGPEKLLELLPICFEEDFSCSNVWLIPLLRRYVVGSSLGSFMHNVIPLAESFQQASQKVKKSVIGKDLQAYARDLWGLLPAFCRYPTDVYQNFGALVKIIIPLLNKDSFMLENIAISLRELVNQSRSVILSDLGLQSSMEISDMGEVVGSGSKLQSKPSYSKKIANKNLRALKSFSEELLQALTKVLLETPSKDRENLKDAIQCLTSITDSSVTRNIFISSLKRFQLVCDFSEGEEEVEFEINATAGKEVNSETSVPKDRQRCLILELASTFVEGADEELVNLLYSFIKKVLEATDGIGHIEAYQALSKLLKEHSWFCSSQFVELVDLLLGVKSPADILSTKSCLACFQPLLIHAVKGSVDEENTKAFLILNQIILMLKDSKDEGRKVAYDALIGISTSLRNSSSSLDGPYYKLINMIIGYLSGSSPHVKSGAVSALSVLVYNDLDICLSVPDLIPSVLGLLQLKAVEVIKAVLGFVKVLVSGLQTKDLQNIAIEIVTGILPWSSVSRHHFRSKVTVILEIMLRKCGSAAIKELVPDKYRDFIKSVLENRHTQTSSTEASTKNSETKHSDSSLTRLQKTKRTESAMSRREGSERMGKRKRDDYRPVKRAEQSDHRNRAGGHARQHGGRDKRSNSSRWPSGGKRNERSASVDKNKGPVQKSHTSSKFSKHNKFGNKRQKFTK